MGGLGARGLVYHAWLGKLVAQAVVEGSDACLPTQLRRWKCQSQQNRIRILQQERLTSAMRNSCQEIQFIREYFSSLT